MYGKIFRSMLEGSLRGKPDEILVFVDMIASADRHGVVDKIPQAIADETGLPLDRVLVAIEALSAPDPNSRNPEHEGRRILLVSPETRNWGWWITGHAFYRAIRNAEERAEQNRKAQETYRNKAKSVLSAASAESAHTDTDTDTDTKSGTGRNFVPPTLEEILGYAKQRGYDWPMYEAEKFLAHHQNNDWTMKGRKRKIKDWRFSIVYWQKNNEGWEKQRQERIRLETAADTALEAERKRVNDEKLAILRGIPDVGYWERTKDGSE